MLRNYLILFLALTIGGLSYAQPNKNKRHEKREQIRAQKIAFISTELELTPEEAQIFWPIYNQYDAEISTIRKSRKTYMKELRKVDELSDERAYELFELIFKSEKSESDIRLNYLKQFSTVLGKKKAAKVFVAEERFKRKLLQDLKDGIPPPPPERP